MNQNRRLNFDTASPAVAVLGRLPGAFGRRAFARQLAAFVALLVAADAVVVWVCLSAAYALRISGGLFAYAGPNDPAQYAEYAWIGVAAWLLAFWVMGLYRRDMLLGGIEEYRQILKACLMGTLGLIIVSFLRRDASELSRGWLVASLSLTVVVVGVTRFALRRVGYALRRRGWLTARALIIGANDQGIEMARHWLENPSRGIRVIGFLDDFKPLATPIIVGAAVLGTPTALETIARESKVDEVILVQNAVAWETCQEIFANLQVKRKYILRVSPGFYDVLSNAPTVSNNTSVPLLTLDVGRIAGVDALLKAGLDFILGLLLSAACAPLIIGFGLALFCRRNSRPSAGQPVLDRHRVSGQGGVPFTMLQFHLPDSGQRDRFECFLFKTGFDKLPELASVLLGRMSLVGTRPRIVNSARPGLRTVKPGIVGLYSFHPVLEPADELRDDERYVRNWTIWLDTQILMNAFLGVVGLRRIRG
ncbi:MAG: sugar transferase, partial [Thermoflexales bacterium]